MSGEDGYIRLKGLHLVLYRKHHRALWYGLAVVDITRVLYPKS
jgi:hypothetical protein